MCYCTDPFFEMAKLKQDGKKSLRGSLAHHTSCQNLTLLPLLTLNLISLKKFSIFLQIHFQTPHPADPDGNLVNQSDLSSPYFACNTCLHFWFLSVPNLHNHLESKALLNSLIDRIPKPTWSIRLYIEFHPTQ